MQKSIVRSLAAAAALSLCAGAASAQVDIKTVQDGVDQVAKTLAPALPFNSALGLNWSDAYIGQLVGVPPHFGIGFSAGATGVKVENLKGLLSSLGYALPAGLDNMLPLPAAMAEARVGGFLLPFDVGLKVGLIPDSAAEALKAAAGDMTVDYLSVGADVRYALLKGNIVLPTISLGAGFNYLRGGVGAKVGSAQTFTFTAPDSTAYNITADKPDVGLKWEATTIDLKAQVSKGLLIFTPYLGVGATYAVSSKAGYYVTSKVQLNGHDITQAEIDKLKADLKAAGITPPDVTAAGIESMQELKDALSVRAFGGFSANLLVVRLDVTGLYNFNDGGLGGSVGLRFQL